MTWVRFLALTAAHPDREFEAATVGRAVFGSAPRGTTVTVVRLSRMDPGLALRHLGALVELFDEGLREPLPIACKSSAAYAEALRNGSDPVKAATGEWDGPWNFAGEGEDLEHQLAFGGVLPFDELLGGTAFDAYARRLWDDVLASEQVEYR
jgi:exodeoxyribonuclease V gamma subunit